MLTWPFYLHCLLSVAVAVCFAIVLVSSENALLCPVIRWCRVTYRARMNQELDDKYWWAPLWGCPTCVSGQWAFWAYVVHYHGPAYHWYEHAYFVALALLFALILQKLLRWSQH